LSFLEESAVTEPTQVDYRRRVAAFELWARLCRMSIDTLPALDLALLVWFEERFFEGDESNEAGKLLAAIRHCRVDLASTPGSLPRASRAAKGWRRLSPLWSRLPIPWEVAALMATRMLNRGRIESAFLTVLTFALYLRPSEALRLTVGSLVAPIKVGPLTRRFWCIVLHPRELDTPSKTGEFDETLVMDSAFFRFLDPILQALARGRSADQPLVGVTYFEWVADFAEAGAACELDALGPPVLYQLRHGGTSFEMMMQVRPLLEIKKRGRWQADASLRRYEKGGRLQQQLQRLGKARLGEAMRASESVKSALCRAFGVSRRPLGARLC